MQSVANPQRTRLSERHVVLIRTSAGNSLVKVHRAEQVARAVSIRKNRGETIHHIGCHVSCWCDGQWGEEG